MKNVNIYLHEIDNFCKFMKKRVHKKIYIFTVYRSVCKLWQERTTDKCISLPSWQHTHHLSFSFVCGVIQVKTCQKYASLITCKSFWPAKLVIFILFATK